MSAGTSSSLATSCTHTLDADGVGQISQANIGKEKSRLNNNQFRRHFAAFPAQQHDSSQLCPFAFGDTYLSATQSGGKEKERKRAANEEGSIYLSPFAVFWLKN